METQTAATGRRKSSVARVRISPGAGTLQINGRTFEDYFPRETIRRIAVRPMKKKCAV